MQAIREGASWVLRLEAGEDVFAVLSEFAERQQVRAATVLFGIGMFRRAAFGYWDGRQYQRHELAEPSEIVAMHGTIAEADGRPSIHLHAAAAGADHHLIGGHLLAGDIGILAEIAVETFPGRTFTRPMVESVGLRMLDLGPGSER